jgi:hypothetical protein
MAQPVAVATKTTFRAGSGLEIVRSRVDEEQDISESAEAASREPIQKLRAWMDLPR